MALLPAGQLCDEEAGGDGGFGLLPRIIRDGGDEIEQDSCIVHLAQGGNAENKALLE